MEVFLQKEKLESLKSGNLLIRVKQVTVCSWVGFKKNNTKLTWSHTRAPLSHFLFRKNCCLSPFISYITRIESTLQSVLEPFWV